MNTKQIPQIVEGTFAQVSTGNCTAGWMIDGDDIQSRANANLENVFGYAVDAAIYQRGVKGFSLMIGGSVLDVFVTRAHAERFLASVL